MCYDSVSSKGMCKNVSNVSAICVDIKQIGDNVCCSIWWQMIPIYVFTEVQKRMSGIFAQSRFSKSQLISFNFKRSLELA